MKSNNANKHGLNFVKNFKFWMLIPMILLLASIIIVSIFGLNYDYDFKTVSTFNIKFNTTITKAEYKTFMDEVDLMCGDAFNNYRIEKIGEGAQNGILVKIANNDGSLDTDIANFKESIEDNLLSNVSENIESSVIITTSEINNILPKNSAELIGYSVLAIACIMLFIFIYYLIRYNLTSSLSIILTFVLEIVMLTSVMIVAKIPFNYYFIISYFVMLFITIFISTYINNYIRTNLNIEKYNKYSNADRVYDACKKTFKPVILFISLLCLSLIAVMFFGNISLLYTVISILIGIVVSVFAEYFFNLSIWAKLYNKDKDAILTKKIENEKKKETKSSDDKIVV